MWAETRGQAAQSGFLSCPGSTSSGTRPATNSSTETLTKVSLSYPALCLLGVPHLCNVIYPQRAFTSPQRPTGSCHLRVILTTGGKQPHPLTPSPSPHWTLTRTWSQAHVVPLAKNAVLWHSPLRSNLAEGHNYLCGAFKDDASALLMYVGP